MTSDEARRLFVNQRVQCDKPRKYGDVAEIYDDYFVVRWDYPRTEWQDIRFVDAKDIEVVW
jgi:hypothetical protein